MSSSGSNAATPAWRTFSFFNAQSVNDRLDPGQTPEVFRSSPEISTITAGQGHVVVADIHGSLHLCNPDLDTTKPWVAHPDGRVKHMKFAGTKGLLVTLGEEETSTHPILKIWNVRHNDKRTGSPRLLVSGRVQQGSTSRSHPVSTFAITASLSLVAIGYADGTVLLLRQVDQYIQSGSTSASAGPAGLPKPKLIHSSPSNPITGLGFRTAALSGGSTNTITNTPAPNNANTANGTQSGNMMLFIVTTHQILSYSTTATGRALLGTSAHATVMDDVGAALGCSTMLPSGDMVLAKDEAIFVYGPEGRGQSYFYEGSKSAISTYLHYIIITSPPFLPSAASNSATVRNFMRDQRTTPASGPASDSSSDISKVTIFDPENKFVAYSGAFPEGVREVFCEWGDVFVLTNDSKLSRLVERPTPEKLGVLFSKNLYLLAISLARTSGLDEGEVADIYRKYGDHLYDKGDFDGAMQQFVKTIGKVQPSYVIRKFLDGQRINNLTSYLQELHAQKLANSDITTLLLNCYAKLKDTARLDEFIKSSSPNSDGDLPFDLETAIRVCRQAGYFDHAVYLAKKYDQPEEYLRIQIEDREEWMDAVRYIRSLGQEAAESNLRRYGKTLLAHIPEQSTELFVDLCCGTLDRPVVTGQPERSGSGDIKSGNNKDSATKSSYLSYLALNRTNTSSPANTPSVNVQNGTNARIPERTASTMTLPASTATTSRAKPPNLTITDADKQDVDNGRTASPTALAHATGPLPEVRQFFAHFIDQPAHFIRFLETVAERLYGQTVDTLADSPAKGEDEDDDELGFEADSSKAPQKAIWSTLVELYLSQASSQTDDPARKSALEGKALKVLQGGDTVSLDTTQALLVCTTAEFVPGILAIYESLEMYENILRFWMDQSEQASSSTPTNTPIASEQVIATLKKFGPEGHANLYPLVLRYLTSSPALLSKHQDDLLEVLDYIDREKIMPPIAVIQALSKTGVATVGLVKDYLKKQIVNEQEEVDADRALTASYRTDLVRKEKEIAELSDPRAPRVFQVTRCSACGGSLDLPAVHFMCRHSYHQRCLADNEASCPNCAANQGVVMEIKQANENLRGRHDLFLEELEEADDRFESVVSAFGRGLVRVGDE